MTKTDGSQNQDMQSRHEFISCWVDEFLHMLSNLNSRSETGSFIASGTQFHYGTARIETQLRMQLSYAEVWRTLDLKSPRPSQRDRLKNSSLS